MTDKMPPKSAARATWQPPAVQRLDAGAAQNAFGGANDTPSGFTGS